jgi:salicylate hydroxylase
MRAVVVGGGVAGSASAIALARVGADVTMYEAYADPAGPVGSYVSLAVNGLRALAALGCLTAVQRAGFPVARHRMWSGRGKPLGDVARGRRGEDELRSVTLMRSDLVRALRSEARRSGAAIVTGQRLGGEPGGDLARDPRLADADVVVGADGIWSAARRMLDPAAAEPAYAGLYAVSGTADASLLPPGRRPADFNWVFGRHGVFIYLAAPDSTLWWTAQVAAPRPPADLSAIGLDELAALFTEALAAEVLAASTGVQAATLLHVLAPVARRHDDRTVLVGDAAHPVGAGQGAAMAVEDAVALARELAGCGGRAAIPAALASFDRLRQARTQKLARTEAANRDAKVSGPVATRMRELIMPLIFSRFYENATGWLYDFDPGELPADASGSGSTCDLSNAYISSMDV